MARDWDNPRQMSDPASMEARFARSCDGQEAVTTMLLDDASTNIEQTKFTGNDRAWARLLRHAPTRLLLLAAWGHLKARAGRAIFGP